MLGLPKCERIWTIIFSRFSCVTDRWTDRVAVVCIVAYLHIWKSSKKFIHMLCLKVFFTGIATFALKLLFVKQC